MACWDVVSAEKTKNALWAACVVKANAWREIAATPPVVPTEKSVRKIPVQPVCRIANVTAKSAAMGHAFRRNVVQAPLVPPVEAAPASPMMPASVVVSLVHRTANAETESVVAMPKPAAPCACWEIAVALMNAAPMKLASTIPAKLV